MVTTYPIPMCVRCCGFISKILPVRGFKSRCCAKSLQRVCTTQIMLVSTYPKPIYLMQYRICWLDCYVHNVEASQQKFGMWFGTTKNIKGLYKRLKLSWYYIWSYVIMINMVVFNTTMIMNMQPCTYWNIPFAGHYMFQHIISLCRNKF